MDEIVQWCVLHVYWSCVLVQGYAKAPLALPTRRAATRLNKVHGFYLDILVTIVYYLRVRVLALRFTHI